MNRLAVRMGTWQERLMRGLPREKSDTLLLLGAIALGWLTARAQTERAVAQAEAGSHVVAPSGMMDGQVAAIRAGWGVGCLNRSALVPDLLPLSIGICFALHWVIFSWILDHPVGPPQGRVEVDRLGLGRHAGDRGQPQEGEEAHHVGDGRVSSDRPAGRSRALAKSSLQRALGGRTFRICQVPHAPR